MIKSKYNKEIDNFGKWRTISYANEISPVPETFKAFTPKSTLKIRC